MNFLNVFVNYDRNDINTLLLCLEQLQKHLKVNYHTYICSTEEHSNIMNEIESIANCKFIYNQNDIVNDSIYEMHIDYSTMLTKDITEIFSCYFYINHLDYISVNNVINNVYLYNYHNTQSQQEFIMNPIDGYTHFDKFYYAGVCGIGKYEEDYLVEWIEWHINLGFDVIYFYDNNDFGNNKQKEICERYSKVIYRDVRGLTFNDKLKTSVNTMNLQFSVYQHCYENNDCKYMMFVDIDEYLVLKTIKSIRDLIRFKKYIHCNIIDMDDNDLVYKDNRPLMQRFTRACKEHLVIDNEYERVTNIDHVSSIIQTGNKVLFQNPHFCFTDVQCYSPSGNKIKNWYSNCNHDFSAVFYHFCTKTVEEVVRKYKRGNPDGNKIKNFYEHFFNINNFTQEKYEYLQEHLK